MKRESEFKIIYLQAKGAIKFFLISAAATILKVAASFAVPQVIRFTVDHVIDDVPLNYIRPVMNMVDTIGGVEYSLKENLWFFAVLILILAFITSISDYIGRITVAKGTEGIIKNLRDKLFIHSFVSKICCGQFYSKGYYRRYK